MHIIGSKQMFHIKVVDMQGNESSTTREREQEREEEQ